MCGRYASIKASADLSEEFQAVDATAGSKVADYNVAPTKQIVAVVERHPRDEEGNRDRERIERSLRMMRWGLVPSWAKDPAMGARMINARAESAATKPAFRRALVERRCLIPADGWYEWRRGEKVKQPYYTTSRDGSSLAMAGLWEYWKPKDDLQGRYPDGLVTACVLTTRAVGPLAEIHDRMPLLLPREVWNAWLNPDLPGNDETIAELLQPPSEKLIDQLELRPVSRLVNSVRNNGPELLVAVSPQELAEPVALDGVTRKQNR